MNSIARHYIDEFNAKIEHCENFCVLTRDSGLQKEACATLRSLITKCRAAKAEAIKVSDEDSANLLLGFECIARCLDAELEMYISLKEEKPDEAWDHLISAQMAAADAARAHRGFAHLESKAKQLEVIETLIFPPQVFVSAGMIVQLQECSICGQEYGECDHLVGKPYWGEFCFIVARGIEANHVAIVKNPADKRCRIMHFSVEGGERNRMTWGVEPSQRDELREENRSIAPEPHNDKNGQKALGAQARLLHRDLIERRRK